jgi:hypothetical protein
MALKKVAWKTSLFFEEHPSDKWGLSHWKRQPILFYGRNGFSSTNTTWRIGKVGNMGGGEKKGRFSMDELRQVNKETRLSHHVTEYRASLHVPWS